MVGDIDLEALEGTLQQAEWEGKASGCLRDKADIQLRVVPLQKEGTEC